MFVSKIPAILCQENFVFLLGHVAAHGPKKSFARLLIAMLYLKHGLWRDCYRSGATYREREEALEYPK